VKIALEKIRHLYGLFIDTVVSGRKAKGLTAARVDELGRGRVWTGALAQSVGLVDKLGGLSEAIDEAARLSGVPLGRDQLPEIETLPKRTVNVVLRAIGLAQGGGVRENEGAQAPAPPAISPAALLTPEGRAALRMLAPLVLEGGVSYQARMPYDVEIR
jgi:protease-4